MNAPRFGNHIRSHRKRTGLSQQNVGFLLGYGNTSAVSRHELSVSIPKLLTAIGYEVVFGQPISKLFPDLRKAVEEDVNKKLAELEGHVQKKAKEAIRQSLISQKIAWLDERRAFQEE